MDPQSSSHDPHAVAPAHGPNFQAYLKVFAILMVLTIASYATYEILKNIAPQVGMWIILGISVVKATCVALVFMHLIFDWPKVYCIVIPVCIMAVMMMIVLLPDGVLGWHNPFALYK